MDSGHRLRCGWCGSMLWPVQSIVVASLHSSVRAVVRRAGECTVIGCELSASGDFWYDDATPQAAIS